MYRSIVSAVILAAMVLAASACGPIVVYPKAELDTPVRHVFNGNQLLKIKKLDAALREFQRAVELDPEYVPGYVGLGLAYGLKGDNPRGMQIMEQANSLAATDEEHQLVRDGFKRLLELGSPSPG